MQAFSNGQLQSCAGRVWRHRRHGVPPSTALQACRCDSHLNVGPVPPQGFQIRALPLSCRKVCPAMRFSPTAMSAMCMPGLEGLGLTVRLHPDIRTGRCLKVGHWTGVAEFFSPFTTAVKLQPSKTSKACWQWLMFTHRTGRSVKSRKFADLNAGLRGQVQLATACVRLFYVNSSKDTQLGSICTRA